MKITKNTSIILLGALLLTGVFELSAQTTPATPAPGAGAPGGRQRGGAGGARGGGANAITNQLAKLSLTTEQEAKIKPILEEQTKKMQELRDASAGSPPDRTKMTEMRAEYMKKIEAVLTTEQKDKLKKLQEEAAAARGNGNGGRQRGGANGANGTPPAAPATPAPAAK